MGSLPPSSTPPPLCRQLPSSVLPLPLLTHKLRSLPSPTTMLSMMTTLALPDGRTQTVTYTTDDVNGYVADVSYDGAPSYPETTAAVAQPAVRVAQPTIAVSRPAVAVARTPLAVAQPALTVSRPTLSLASPALSVARSPLAVASPAVVSRPAVTVASPLAVSRPLVG